MTQSINAERESVKVGSIATVYPGRYTAAMPDDFVVFLLGMRLNRPWKVHKWLPVFSAMPRMLRLLDRQPEGRSVEMAQRVDRWAGCRAVLARALRTSSVSRGDPSYPTCRPGSGSTTRSAHRAR